MIQRTSLLFLAASAVLLASASFGTAQAPRLVRQDPFRPLAPPKYDPAEPMAEVLSLDQSADYLDGVARAWMKSQMCGECHVNYTYLMARPLLGKAQRSLAAKSRKYIEDRIPQGKHRSRAESAVIAATLAWDDAHTTGKLQPSTRNALAQMWREQHPIGSWRQLGCGDGFPPAENDQNYVAALAAVAAGIAPDGYAQTTEAKDGLTKLRRFLQNRPPKQLHDRTAVLWASCYVDGLLTTDERQAVIKDLLAHQRPGGGWSFDALAPQRGHFDCKLAEHDRGNNPIRPKDPPSDGYGTGFAVFVLRQAGVPASHPQIVRGIGWLQSNQRLSGRWHTPSPDAGVEPEEFRKGTRDLAVLNAGTGFAVLALKACE
jgi:squalene-hopene/tetraprenyl-beta-curcumene cyclase